MAAVADHSGRKTPKNKAQTTHNMPATDYVPSRLADFALWCANFSTKLTATPTLYGLTAPDAVAVAATAGDFASSYAASSTPATRTSATIAQTAAQRAIATALIRPYAVRISANTSVDPSDKIDIGVTVRSLIPTPIPPPTTTPALALESAISLNQTLRYFDTSTPTAKAKPFGAATMQVWRAIGIVAAVDPEQSSFYANVTKSPFVVNFDAAAKGKVVTYFARWQTVAGAGGKSATGPWSEPLSLSVM